MWKSGGEWGATREVIGTCSASASGLPRREPPGLCNVPSAGPRGVHTPCMATAMLIGNIFEAIKARYPSQPRKTKKNCGRTPQDNTKKKRRRWKSPEHGKLANTCAFPPVFSEVMEAPPKYATAVPKKNDQSELQGKT